MIAEAIFTYHNGEVSITLWGVVLLLMLAALIGPKHPRDKKEKKQ